MLLDEIEQFSIIRIPTDDFEVAIPFCTDTGKDIDPEAWARRNRDVLNERKDGDPYLRGIMEKD